ncbi:MAG: hypothetical protein RLZZ436_1511 [Planctomycetota bacterium]|jgi:hypothetical protein
MCVTLYWNFIADEEGFILSSEALLIATVAILGLLVGITSVRDSVLTELDDFADAMGFLNQAYSYAGVTDAGGTASTSGGLLEDTFDADDGAPLTLEDGPGWLGED